MLKFEAKKFLMKKILLALILPIIIFSCQQNENKKAEQNLFDEVIDIHYVAMGEMDNIFHLKKLIRQHESKLDSNAAMQLSNLQEANDQMMDWMGDFKTSDNIHQSEYQKYLREEKIKVGIMKDFIFSAIEEAQDFLNKNNIPYE